MGSLFSFFVSRDGSDQNKESSTPEISQIDEALPKLLTLPGALNLECGVDGNSLLLSCPNLSSDFGISHTGKTHVVASTRGHIHLADSGVSVFILVYRRIGETFNDAGLQSFNWKGKSTLNLDASLSGHRLTMCCDLTSSPEQNASGQQKWVIASTRGNHQIGSSGVFISVAVFAPDDDNHAVNLDCLGSYSITKRSRPDNMNEDSAADEEPRKRPRIDDFTALFFPDDPESLDTMVAVLRAAKATLDVAVFLLTEDTLADVLVEKHREGVTVRVICDDSMEIEFDTSDTTSSGRLCRAGIEVRRDRTKYHMHHKFAVVDGCTSLCGSFNWTKPSACGLNRENVLICRREDVAGQYAARFQTLWKTFHPENEDGDTVPLAAAGSDLGGCRVLFYPDVDDTNFDFFTHTLRSATESIDVAVFILSVREAISALKAAHDRGVRVRVITDNNGAKVHGGQHVEDLRRAGIEVREDRSSYNMHHKIGIIDGTTVITGSFNWTRQAEDHNEEDCIVLQQDSAAAVYTACFERMWAEFA